MFEISGFVCSGCLGFWICWFSTSGSLQRFDLIAFLEFGIPGLLDFLIQAFVGFRIHRLLISGCPDVVISGVW